MKYFFTWLLFVATTGSAQTILQFDKRFVESEDRWVAFQMDKDGSYQYGFIYIDAQAGLTFNYEGRFKITGQGVFVPEKIDSFIMKSRLEPNQVKVAFIPESKFNELKIDAVPEWLKFYKTDTASIERLYRWGFLYNSWDECSKALTYLERAQKINPKFKGLEFELAFAYNALQQYDKAITVLQSALETSPADCLLYKELSFAEMQSGQLNKAVETSKKGIDNCSNKQWKAEIAYNIAYQFYKAKDKVNFALWANETKKWATKGDRYSTNVTKMEENIDK